MQGKILIIGFIAVLLMAACKGMYDSLDEYSGEVIYPAKYDTIVGRVGFERVEIDLMKAGRIPSSRINLGKATKTVVEYDGKVVTIDSLVSWINITGLDQPKLYRFRVYTIDEFENKSVPQEIALIPFTSSDIEALAINAPRILSSPTAAVVDWPNGLTSVLFDYKSLAFKYTDKDGIEREGTRQQDSRLFIANLQSGETATINMTYNVVPKINNSPILDTVPVVRELAINMPVGSTPFNPVERTILETNGVSVFTADGVSSVIKLEFPLHVSSFQDLFYFSNLREIDLTGGTLFSMKTMHYDVNGVQSTIGGGDFSPFVRKVGDISPGDAQVLKDLLESGVLQRVYYKPHSLGLDEMLQSYVASGIVELVNAPQESVIPMKFLMDGVIQSTAWRMDMELNPTDAPPGVELENVIKTTLVARNASFIFALPTDYRYNFQEYRYLKFKVFSPPKSLLGGNNASYRRIWPRFLNHLWGGWEHESTFGQEYWAPDPNNFRIPDDQLEKWHELTVDLSQATNRHNRMIIINIGGEPSAPFDPATTLVYYFSNFRFAKSL